MNLERRVLALALGSGAFGTLVALALLWLGDHGAKTRITLTVLMLVLWLSFAFSVRGRIVFTLQTLSNLLAALREGDYSIRGRMSRSGGSLDDVIRELNLLGETLREQRLDALEASALLRKVMEEINIAVFTFDGERRLRLTNRAGERMLGEPAERLLGRDAADLGLAHCLEGETARTVQMKLATGSGPWEVRRGTFREKGAPHHLLVLADLSRALREEERQVWQRLIRVLGHELNNSLAPVKSIVQSLVTLLTRPELPTDWREDALRGLSVIGSRTESLTRFMEAYARLARLPAPRLEKVDVVTWIRRVAALETRLPVTLVPGPELSIRADGVQLEQLMINLVRNAVDASLTTGGGVEVGWRRNGTWLEVIVDDEGPGLQNTANLFVPFFTTKPSGTGIGLVLSRQIVEAHGGSLTLENRGTGRGCEAKLKLPLGPGTRGPETGREP
jgi:PAS domain S-box-containing protein